MENAASFIRMIPDDWQSKILRDAKVGDRVTNWGFGCGWYSHGTVVKAHEFNGMKLVDVDFDNGMAWRCAVEDLFLRVDA